MFFQVQVVFYCNTLFQVSDYRFSISWTRIFPDGVGPTPNPEGVAFYRDFIDALVALEIEPLVTIFHWDLPQALEDYGGWLNESNNDLFLQYADTCYRLFGDKVNKEIPFIIIYPFEKWDELPQASGWYCGTWVARCFRSLNQTVFI